MNESHFFRNALLLVGGLILAGWLAIAAIGFIFHMIGYIIVGALVVGGGYYLYSRGKRALREGKVRRRITRY